MMTRRAGPLWREGLPQGAHATSYTVREARVAGPASSAAAPLGCRRPPRCQFASATCLSLANCLRKIRRVSQANSILMSRANTVWVVTPAS